MIQSVMLVPVCISFATIIFRDTFFVNHLPMLIKLVMFSCTIHQVVFTARSTLPFAVGQVTIPSPPHIFAPGLSSFDGYADHLRCVCVCVCVCRSRMRG